MKLGYEFLENFLSKKGLSVSDLADRLGITVQAIHGWKESNLVPSKRVSQIADILGPTSEEVDQLLGVPPLLCSFRTKKGEDLHFDDVAQRTRFRTETIFSRFFGSENFSVPYDLSGLRRKVSEAGDDFFKIAELIREEFRFPDYQPMTNDFLIAILDRVKVKAYYLPFKSIGLVDEQDSEQTAVLFKKDNQYAMLLDSDRRVDEAHFDRAHELVHIFTEGYQGDQAAEERLIDKVCGELIYPKKYLVERYFDGEPASKPIKDKSAIRIKFFEDLTQYKWILSPKGLALAMRDAGLCTISSELYKFLAAELHSEFRDHGLTFSKLGKMDFDFSDIDALMGFFNFIEEGHHQSGYPLFVKLRADLVSGALSPSDFADTFKLSLADALIVKTVWSQK